LGGSNSYWPADGGTGSSRWGRGEIGQVEQLVLSVPSSGGLLEHPVGDGLTSAAGAGAAENDGDADL
jgi:hypothetical protein